MDVFIDEKNNHILVSGNEGFLKYFDLNNLRWSSQPSFPITFGINRIFFISPNRGWAVGYDGSIGLIGALYSPQYSRITECIYDIEFKDWNNGVAVCGENKVLITSNSGSTWKLYESR